MGGWCHIRDSCPRYYAQTGMDPSERLCDPADDGRIAGQAIVIRRAAGTWERRPLPSQLRPADPFDALVSA
jgi:hypothetical protein